MLNEDKYLREGMWSKIRENTEKMGMKLQNSIYVEGQNKTDYIVDAQSCFGIPAVMCRYFVDCWICIFD